MNLNRLFRGFVVSYYTIDIYDIVIIQDPYGNLVALRVEEYDE